MIGDVKVFGAALDALDDPDRVALKRAWVEALAAGRIGPDEPADPYDAITPYLSEYCTDIVLTGKLDIPGSLTPRPSPEEMNVIDPVFYRTYLDSPLNQSMLNQCQRFVEHNVLPGVSGMLAVDHSFTACNFNAVARLHGMENVSLIILDSHFDAIPAALRIPADMAGMGFPEMDSIHCGNFILHMIDKEMVLPENIIVIGPSDYPPDEISGEGDSVSGFREAYLSFINRGVKVIPKSRSIKPSFLSYLDNLLEEIRTPYLYVSMDADIGSCSCMNAVRFMDTVGLGEEAITGMAKLINRHITNGRLELVGFDVSEVDVHLLGLIGPDGEPDRTAQVCARFVGNLLRCEK